MTIYLVRHGEPDVPEKMCLGCRLDPGLSPRGRAQAERLQRRFAGKARRVYASPLRRSVETARLLAGGEPIALYPELREQDMGAWDGLPFREIRERYPELYRRRGEDITLLPDGAEPFEDVARRMFHVLSRFDGSVDAVAVGHAGAIRALLCQVTGLPFSECRSFSLPYGSVTALFLQDDVWHVGQIGVMPFPSPDMRDIEEMWLEARTPEAVIVHCRAVADAAVEIARNLDRARHPVNVELVRSAALLHDVCRTEPHHATAGAELVERHGYPGIADIIRRHHRGRELEEGSFPNEADIVFYADKIVRGMRRVTLERRFAESLKRCATPEAQQSHESQWRAATSVRRRLEALTGQGYQGDQP